MSAKDLTSKRIIHGNENSTGFGEIIS